MRRRKVNRNIYTNPSQHAPNADRVHRFTQRLHGSGINGDWSIEETKTSVRASNIYETMTEYGMYDSVVPFTVIFPKGEPMSNFKLQFSSGSQNQVKKYMLREYLEEEIAMTINELGL